MGFFSTLASGISNACHAVCDFCGKIGGSVMSGISNTMTSLVTLLPPLHPAIPIVEIVIGKIIPFLAELLLGKPKEERPEDLGVKSEKAYEEEGLTPEDFNSVDEYIKYIRENIKIDKEELERMTAEDREKYAMVGSGLYTRSFEENYGVKIEPEFFNAVFRCGMDKSVDTISAILKAMSDYGIKNSSVFDSYLSEKLEPGSSLAYDMHDALKDVLKSESKIEELIQNYKQYEHAKD